MYYVSHVAARRTGASAVERGAQVVEPNSWRSDRRGAEEGAPAGRNVREGRGAEPGVQAGSSLTRQYRVDHRRCPVGRRLSFVASYTQRLERTP